MTDLYQVDYEALFDGIDAGIYEDGASDKGIRLPCGLGAKPVRYWGGHLSSQIDIQRFEGSTVISGTVHVAVGLNGELSIPFADLPELREKDWAILSLLAKNIAKHPRSS